MALPASYDVSVVPSPEEDGRDLLLVGHRHVIGRRQKALRVPDHKKTQEKRGGSAYSGAGMEGGGRGGGTLIL